MPRLKPSEQEEASRIIRANIAYGMERQHTDNKELAIRLGVDPKTIRNKINRPDTFTFRELRTVAKALKFTPIQAASILLGRELTAKELKDFILM